MTDKRYGSLRTVLLVVLILVVLTSAIALALHPNIWEPLGW
jgi:hypothetical protein